MNAANDRKNNDRLHSNGDDFTWWDGEWRRESTERYAQRMNFGLGFWSWPGVEMSPPFPKRPRTAWVVEDIRDIGYGSLWRHYNGNLYVVSNYANLTAQNGYSPTIIYNKLGDNDRLYSRSLDDWGRSMTRVTVDNCPKLPEGYQREKAREYLTPQFPDALAEFKHNLGGFVRGVLSHNMKAEPTEVDKRRQNAMQRGHEAAKTVRNAVLYSGNPAALIGNAIHKAVEQAVTDKGFQANHPKDGERRQFNGHWFTWMLGNTWVPDRNDFTVGLVQPARSMGKSDYQQRQLESYIKAMGGYENVEHMTFDRGTISVRFKHVEEVGVLRRAPPLQHTLMDAVTSTDSSIREAAQHFALRQARQHFGVITDPGYRGETHYRTYPTWTHKMLSGYAVIVLARNREDLPDDERTVSVVAQVLKQADLKSNRLGRVSFTYGKYVVIWKKL